MIFDTNKVDFKRELFNWFILLLLAIVWGSSFLLMKRGMFDKATGELIFSHSQVAALRMFIAAAFLFPLALPYWKKINVRKYLIPLLIVGFFGNFFPAFLFTYAESGVSSGLAGMLNSCVPIFTIIIGYGVFKTKVMQVQIVGVAVGTIGIVWLVSTASSLSVTGTIWHVLAVVLATLFYATSLNTIKYKLVEVKPLAITAMAFSATLPFSGVLVWTQNTTGVIMNNPIMWRGLIPILVLAIIGTALSVILFNYLIARSSAIFASSVTYFIPIVAIIIGLWDGERLFLQQMLAMLIILIGVFTVNLLPKLLKKTP